MASEYLKWKYRNEKPPEKRALTPAEKRANWWHYHKWHTAIAAVLILSAGSILWHVLGVGEAKPDIQIAYVGADPLPADTAAALQRSLAGLFTDCDGDGAVTVQLNQYVTGSHTNEADGVYYAYAASAKLMADITACDSYLFLLDDPDTFQRNYAVLRPLSGDSTAEGMPWSGCALRWSDCPVLTGLDMGAYTENMLDQQTSGDSQALLSGLYVARRGFWTEKTCAYPDACNGLWDTLTEGAAS